MWRTDRSNEQLPHGEGRKIENILSEDEAVDRVFDHPKIRSYMSIDYNMPESAGRELRPGHRLAFIIPEEYHSRIVRDIVLKHRKDQKYAVDIGPDRYDPNGAYSNVEVRDVESGDWKGWEDPSGYNPIKFAEPRSAADPEVEVLHDWLATVGPLKIDAARVTNVGKHPELSTSNIHGVEIIFYPELDGVDFRERVYCEGTEFIDVEKNKMLPSYGGGEHTSGRYSGAITLNSYRKALYELGSDPGEGARVEDGKLLIALAPGKKLVQVEVSVGDTELLPEGQINSETQRNTRLGWAKLWIGIRRKNNGTDWFVENANIPPQGVIAGGPHLDRAEVAEGDELVIESKADAAYVMGWRLAYEKN